MIKSLVIRVISGVGLAIFIARCCGGFVGGWVRDQVAWVRLVNEELDRHHEARMRSSAAKLPRLHPAP